MIQKFSRGDVYYCNLGKIKFNSNVEGKNRPCVIISNNAGNSTSNTLLVAPITTRSNKGLYPCQVYFYNGKDQVVLCEQLRVIDKTDVGTYVGKLDDVTMSKIDVALKIELDLPITETERYVDGIASSILSKVYKRVELKTEEFCETLSSQIKKDYDSFNNELNIIKESFDKNQIVLNSILKSMVDVYAEFNNNNSNDSVSKVKNVNINNNEQLDDKKYLIQIVKDYYALTEIEFIKKYNLTDKKQRSNKKSAASIKLLKKYNFDYKTLKEYKNATNKKVNNVINYNSNDECIAFITLTSDKNGIKEACNKHNISVKSVYNFRAKCRKVLAEKNIYI